MKTCEPRCKVCDDSGLLLNEICPLCEGDATFFNEDVKDQTEEATAMDQIHRQTAKQ